MLGRFLVCAAVALGGLQAAALPVHVALEWPAGMPESRPAHIHIQAIQTAGSSNRGVPLETDATPDGAVLDLSDGVWRLQAFAPGYWSQETEIVIARKTPEVGLSLWPAAFLHGQVETAGGESLPDTLEVHLSATPSANEIGQTPPTRSTPSPSRAELHCRIDAGSWSCTSPAGLFDIRIAAAGYAPRYEWGVSLKTSESADFGRTELRRTPSLFGRVLRNDGSNPPGPCRATLRPDMARHGPSRSGAEAGPEIESAPRAKTSYSLTLNRRGYFQVVDVLPGNYALSVACQAASAFRNVRVLAQGETRIDPPLALEELTLDLLLTPKTDPARQPWNLAVYETAPHYLLIANGATTSADGRWRRRGLMAGNYHIVVRSSDGTAWLDRYFDLRTSTGALLLDIGSVRVAGRVMMSSQPLRARLVFTNNRGGESATLTSDENGHFQGLLPSRPGVQESNWTVEAHVVQPPVTQRLLDVNVPLAADGASTWLDLELPTIPVHGTVVSPDGKQQPNVQVTFEDSKGLRTTTSTDNAGRFEMPDLPPGKYSAVAGSLDGSSDRTPFEVTEGGSRELRLVLNPFKRYSLYIVSSQGPVADAAIQVWIAPGVPRAFVRTDENGRFEVTLPPRTTEVGLTIGAPGYALKMTRLPISSESEDSPDARTITLDTTAGTLVINFQPPGRALDDFSTQYLVHKGAIQDARTIAGWGSDQAGSANGPAIVDEIEPGDYALCRVDPSNVAALWRGALPSSSCRKGSLEQNGTLNLSPQ